MGVHQPLRGRGLRVGLIHAQQLRDVVREHLDDPTRFARAWDETTERLVARFYWEQISADRVRVAEIAALREGVPPPAPDPAITRF